MVNETLSDNARLVEVLLFLENEPLELERLCELTNLAADEVVTAIREIREHCFKYRHGLDLVKTDAGFQFLPAEDLHGNLGRIYSKKVDRRLTRAAMETLSIVAYGQPITRREIDNIRGVVSDTIVRILRERDYIKIVGRKDVPGHPCLYATTRKFLLEFGLQSIGDLPQLTEIDRQRFETDET